MQASDSESPPPASSPPGATGAGIPADPLGSIKFLLLIIVICQVGWIVHSTRTRPPKEPEPAVTRSAGEKQQVPTPTPPTSAVEVLETASPSHEPASPSPEPVVVASSAMPERTDAPPALGGHITFNQFVAMATALEPGPDALSPVQKKQAAQLVQHYEETSLRIAGALQGILRVLNARQRQRMLNASPLASNAIVDADQDPFLELVYLKLRDKAGSTPAPPVNFSPLEQITDRQGIFEGLVFLESQPALALSPAQARAAVDSLVVIRLQLRRRAVLEQKLSALLTPRQVRASLRAQQTLDVDGSVGLLVRHWLKRPQGAR